MKISILNGQAPFVRGGAEYLAESLENRLRERGHDVCQIRVPFKWYPAECVAEHMAAARLLRVDAGSPDLVIALKFPAYLAPHGNKRVWLLHQFRQVYDLWGTEFGHLSDTPENRRLAEMVRKADTDALSGAKGLYTISGLVAERLKKYNDLTADGVLYPPLDRPELFGPGAYGRYFFYPSRLNEMKRQHLAIEAIARVPGDVRLVIAGKADEEGYGRRLRKLVDDLGVGHRVDLLGYVSEEDKARHMRECLAVVNLPYQEDYGYVTVEAFHCAKAVLTFNDSGGTNELVADGEAGLVTEPTAEALAAAMRRLADAPAEARALGDGALRTLGRKGIRWDAVLDKLTQ